MSNPASVSDTRRDSVMSNFFVVKPWAAAWARDGSRASVSNEISETLEVIDDHMNELISTIPIDGARSKPGTSR
jgi:hypothetical protein